MSFSTAYPTEVAASLVFVVQSPTAGLFVPSASLWPLAGTVVEGDVVVVVVGEVDDNELEQAGRKIKVATSTTEAAAMDRRGNVTLMRAIVRSGTGAN